MKAGGNITIWYISCWQSQTNDDGIKARPLVDGEYYENNPRRDRTHNGKWENWDTFYSVLKCKYDDLTGILLVAK